MTVTVIDLDPNTTPVSVTVQRKDLGALDINGIASNGVFGITSGNIAYFDTAQATSGEGAGLGYDGSTGRWYLDRGSAGDQLHLLAVRHLRVRAWANRTPTGELAPQTLSGRARAWQDRAQGETSTVHISRPARPWVRPL
jgi:hypothetical protein